MEPHYKNMEPKFKILVPYLKEIER